jgi:hypothetical protein
MNDRGELSMESVAGWEAEQPTQQADAVVTQTEQVKAAEFDDPRLDQAQKYLDDYKTALQAGDVKERMDIIEDKVIKDPNMLALFKENAQLLLKKGFEPLLKTLFGQDQLQTVSTLPLEAARPKLEAELRQAATDTLAQVKNLTQVVAEVTVASPEAGLAFSPAGAQETAGLNRQAELLQQAADQGDASKVREVITFLKEGPLQSIQTKVLNVAEYVGVKNLSETSSLTKLTETVIGLGKTIQGALDLTPKRSAAAA